MLFSLSELHILANSNSLESNSNVIKENQNADNNKGAAKLIPKITQELKKIYGSKQNFERAGGMFFDEQGILHLAFKKPFDEMNSRAVEAISRVVEDPGLVLKNVVKYSAFDLRSTKDQIVSEIENYYTPEEYINISFSISASVPKQKVILEHQGLPEELLVQLKENYGEIFEEQKTETVFAPTKGREGDWNQLGAGLSIKNIWSEGCTTAGMASKSGNYFILTAGHCFRGYVSSTGGDLIRQYELNVGRQHATGVGRGLDVGLVRVTANELIGGRYATNKIKRWDSTEVFDGSFVGWTTLYDGMEVCKTGKESDTTCGTVVNANTTVKYDEYPTFYVAEINGSGFSIPGDSGGATFYKYGYDTMLLAGVVSGNKFIRATGEVTGGYVTQYRDIESNYGIVLYTSDTNYKITN
ncbi:S1 family peptidase [Mesobacillus subterraneus]|uniref:S1 family peptidase n=1 Tax=Mesobacillus subterraneus TaxID=285983 RepID=UPI00203CBD0F|nr:S1 family peptidase [Mesobacillus subterraneus]MCM3576360.1 S1 family peptidase [Mesobacillus subterraneus]